MYVYYSIYSNYYDHSHLVSQKLSRPSPLPPPALRLTPPSRKPRLGASPLPLQAAANATFPFAGTPARTPACSVAFWGRKHQQPTPFPAHLQGAKALTFRDAPHPRLPVRRAGLDIEGPGPRGPARAFVKAPCVVASRPRGTTRGRFLWCSGRGPGASSRPGTTTRSGPRCRGGNVDGTKRIATTTLCYVLI